MGVSLSHRALWWVLRRETPRHRQARESLQRSGCTCPESGRQVGGVGTAVRRMERRARVRADEGEDGEDRVGRAPARLQVTRVLDPTAGDANVHKTTAGGS